VSSFALGLWGMFGLFACDLETVVLQGRAGRSVLSLHELAMRYGGSAERADSGESA
jgi:hypothetical protein